MKRVRIYVTSLATELESITENYQWVRDKVYRRHGVQREQISLLRRALAARGNLTEIEFSKQTGVPPDAASRAAKFLADTDRQWIRLEKKKTDRRLQYVVATPEGLREIEALDREVQDEFFRSLDIAEGSKEVAQIAAAAGELNQRMRDFVLHRQTSLFM